MDAGGGRLEVLPLGFIVSADSNRRAAGAPLDNGDVELSMTWLTDALAATPVERNTRREHGRRRGNNHAKRFGPTQEDLRDASDATRAEMHQVDGDMMQSYFGASRTSAARATSGRIIPSVWFQHRAWPLEGLAQLLRRDKGGLEFTSASDELALTTNTAQALRALPAARKVLVFHRGHFSLQVL